MVTLEQLSTLEGCLKFALQKLTFARNAIRHLETKRASVPDLTGHVLDFAEKDAKRQEQILLSAADELADELTTILKQAEAEAAAGGEQ